MVKELAVCGDSFGCGIGLPWDQCFEKSFGGLVASHFNLDLKIYSRSGCCNYVIWLQVQKIIEEFEHKKINPIVLITTTNHSRFTFPSDYSTKEYKNYKLEDVDYLSYFPYSDKSDVKRELPFKQNKNPLLISNTLSNLSYHISNEKTSGLESFFRYIKLKLSAINQYYSYLYDDCIKETYDYSLILMMHQSLKEARIPHLIMNNSEHQCRFIDKSNFFLNNWGEYCQRYPDAMKSGHCDEHGHREVADRLIKRIEEML